MVSSILPSVHISHRATGLQSAVKIAMNLLSQQSPDIALLNYRATSHFATGVNPAETLMGRQLQARVPTIPENLRPAVPSMDKLRQSDKSSKAKAKEAYDRRHGARVLQDLQPGDLVLMKTEKEEKWSQPGTVVTSDPENRTYLVNTPHGTLRRNR